MKMIYYATSCLWITAVMTVTIASPPKENIRQERDLMVVLPVLQGRNISGDKLQYVFTKAPVTMLIRDTQPTTHRPISTKSWPASFASKAQVFLVEPSMRQTSPHHYYPESVRNITHTTQRPNYTGVFHLAKLTTKPTNPPLMQFPSDNQSNPFGSKVTWEKSTNESRIKWVGAKDVPSTQPTAAPAATLNITANNLPQFNSSSINTSMLDDKTVAQLAWDFQATTNRLTNDVKSILLHLGILAQGSSPQEDSNDLGGEGSENTNSDTSNSFMQFKNIPVRDGISLRDDMRQLLTTFGLLSIKNETNSTDEANRRLKRDTKKQGFDGPLDEYQLPNSKVLNKPSNSVPVETGFETNSIKPLASFGQQQLRIKNKKQARAVDTGASTNKLVSKDGEPNSKGTASVEQLSGSFGGEPIAEQNSIPKKTNGLYFWVDWNTFFNLTGTPNVRLAYSSKAGDLTKFLSIADWRTKLN